MARGTFVHEVLEVLMALPAEDRTEATMEGIATGMWTAMDRSLLLDDASAWKIKSHLAIAYNLLEPPIQDVRGREVKLNGELGGVEILGFADLLLARWKGLEVVDYKTGSAPEKGKPWTTRNEEEKLLQLRLYAAYLREIGHTVSKVSLFFLGERSGVVSRPATDEDLDAAVDILVQTRNEMEDARGVPEPNSGPLCGWCDFLGICEEGQRAVRVRISKGKNVPDVALELI